ncbi:MAG: hypothetical protein M3Y25_05700 [Thermoproteota archaeon]|nr:hypothetical protein [Thermoproteota archaeon]
MDKKQKATKATPKKSTTKATSEKIGTSTNEPVAKKTVAKTKSKSSTRKEKAI